ncbi:MAG: hypothetical protein KF761_00320 [Salinibacterium sp.]|nr:hypothetical protein [Salinibacterium sp.]
MARITTPFDSFMSEFSAWVDSAWFVWIALAATVAAVIAIVVITKVRTRARDRVPQYRRRVN